MSYSLCTFLFWLEASKTFELLSTNVTLVEFSLELASLASKGSLAVREEPVNIRTSSVSNVALTAASLCTNTHLSISAYGLSGSLTLRVGESPSSSGSTSLWLAK